MAVSELKARMEMLQDQIQQAEHRLKLKGVFSADHKATSAELHDRHQLVSQMLQDEVEAEEAHGHHVGGLELSVRKWLDSLEIELD